MSKILTEVGWCQVRVLGQLHQNDPLRERDRLRLEAPFGDLRDEVPAAFDQIADAIVGLDGVQVVVGGGHSLLAQ